MMVRSGPFRSKRVGKMLNSIAYCALFVCILHIINGRKANWIGHALHSNCVLKHVTEGKLWRGNKRQEEEEENVISYWMTLTHEFLSFFFFVPWTPFETGET